MNKQMYLLLAALIIAPALSYGMANEQPDQPKAAEQQVVNNTEATPAADQGATTPIMIPTTQQEPVQQPAVIEPQQPAASATSSNLPETSPAASTPTEVAPLQVDIPAPAESELVIMPELVYGANPAPQRNIAKLYNWLRSMIFPRVALPTINADATVDRANLVDGLEARVNQALNAEASNAGQTKSRHRRIALATFTNLAGIGSMSAYVWKYGMPTLSRINGLKAVGTILGAVFATQWLFPQLNTLLNRRGFNNVVNQFTANIKNTGHVTPEIAAQVKAKFAAPAGAPTKMSKFMNIFTSTRQQKANAIINAMTAAPAPVQAAAAQ